MIDLIGVLWLAGIWAVFAFVKHLSELIWQAGYDKGREEAALEQLFED